MLGSVVTSDLARKRNMPSEVVTLRTRVEALESLCGEMYQVAGTIGAPVSVLDKLWAAAQGEAIQRRHGWETICSAASSRSMRACRARSGTTS